MHSHTSSPIPNPQPTPTPSHWAGAMRPHPGLWSSLSPSSCWLPSLIAQEVQYVITISLRGRWLGRHSCLERLERPSETVSRWGKCDFRAAAQHRGVHGRVPIPNLAPLRHLALWLPLGRMETRCLVGQTSTEQSIWPSQALLGHGVQTGAFLAAGYLYGTQQDCRDV